jgi:hypothetical protein
MLVKEFKSLIAIECDRDGSNNNPVLLELKTNKILWITYTHLGILSKKQLPCDLEGEWSFATTLDRLKEVMSKARGPNEIFFQVEDDKLLITMSKDGKGNEVSLTAWGAKPKFDLDEFEGDDQLLVVDTKAWVEIWQAGQVVMYNENPKDKQDVMSSYVRLDVWNMDGYATGYSPGIISHRQFPLKEAIAKNRTFLVPISLIAMVTTMKLQSTLIKMRMSSDFLSLLTVIDDKYFLTDVPPLDKYPVLDGIIKEKGAEANTVTIEDKKTLQETLQAAQKAGIKNATLIFNNGQVTVDVGNKVPSASVPASATKNFTSTVKLSVTLLLDALKAINVAKILLLFPVTTGKALIIETLTGIVYVILAITKVVTHVIESTKEHVMESAKDVVASKPQPQVKEVDSGKTSDNKVYVIEAVEENPLPELAGKPEEKLAQARAQLASVLQTIEGLEKTPASPEALEELRHLEIVLEEVLKETQSITSRHQQQISSNEYPLDDLETVALRMYWLGGRTLSFVLRKEKTWHLRIRIVDPGVVTTEKIEVKAK